MLTYTYLGFLFPLYETGARVETLEPKPLLSGMCNVSCDLPGCSLAEAFYLQTLRAYLWIIIIYLYQFTLHINGIFSAVCTCHHHHQVARPAVSIAISITERHLEWSCARSHAELRPRLVGCRSVTPPTAIRGDLVWWGVCDNRVYTLYCKMFYYK